MFGCLREINGVRWDKFRMGHGHRISALISKKPNAQLLCIYIQKWKTLFDLVVDELTLRLDLEFHLYAHGSQFYV